MSVDTVPAALRQVGRSVPQIDIDDKLAGRTRYVADLDVPGMLHAVLVRSPVPHGRLHAVDVARARRVPGVRAVITADDVPAVPFGPYVPDWQIFARDKVRFIGDDVAAVAATTLEAALEAAALVTMDIDPLPEVYDPHDAVADGAPTIWDERPDNVASRFSIARGDVDAAFDGAAHVFEGRYTTNAIYHAYLEPIGVVAAFDRGVYTLQVPTHIPYKARITYATALGVPLGAVRIVVPPIGGSFGAKYEMTVPLVAAVLARVTGHPVRVAFDREEDAAVAHPRPPFTFHNRIAVASDGRFVGRETEVLGNAGGRTFWSPTVLATAVHRVDALYHFGTMRGHGRLAYTNTNPTTCMRGFGNAESLFGMEQMIDEIAESLGVDPVELRLRNIVRDGDTTLHGWRISSSALPQCIARADELSGYRTRRTAVTGGRGTTGVRRGMGIAIAHHVAGHRSILKDFDGSSALLRIGGDGAVGLYVGEPDIGQAQSTVLAQIVAETLGIDAAEVRVHGVDSELSPAAVGTLASRATTLAGQAAKHAAEAARGRLAEFLADHWSVPVDSVAFGPDGFGAEAGSGDDEPVSLREAAHRYGVAHCGLPLIGEGVYRPPTELPDADGYGNVSAAYPFTAHVAEVEVDCGTGQVRVLGYWAVHDSGTIINPQTARGQVLGAIAQGVGWALMEDVTSADGRVTNPDFLDYRIPGADDMAPETVVEFVDSYEPNGPHGAKSLAEAAINPVVAALANAVHDATGIRMRSLPMSPERLWTALREPATQAAPTARSMTQADSPRKFEAGHHDSRSATAPPGDVGESPPQAPAIPESDR